MLDASVGKGGCGMAVVSALSMVGPAHQRPDFQMGWNEESEEEKDGKKKKRNRRPKKKDDSSEEEEKKKRGGDSDAFENLDEVLRKR